MVFQIKEELRVLMGENIKACWTLCSASKGHPIPNFSEMSSGPARILLNADPPGPPTLALKTKEAALLRRYGQVLWVCSGQV